MRKNFRYRTIANGYHEHRTIYDFAGEYIGIRDVYDKMIYEGDFVKGYDIMLKEHIKGTVTYVPTAFYIKTCDGYYQSLDNLKSIELIKP